MQGNIFFPIVGSDISVSGEMNLEGYIHLWGME